MAAPADEEAVVVADADAVLAVPVLAAVLPVRVRPPARPPVPVRLLRHAAAATAAAVTAAAAAAAAGIARSPGYR